MEKTVWTSLHPVQQAILLAMAEYEEKTHPGGTYKVRRLMDYCATLFTLDADEFTRALYGMAAEGAFVRHQGNIGKHEGGKEVSPGALPELVEVALTEQGKQLTAI